VWLAGCERRYIDTWRLMAYAADGPRDKLVHATATMASHATTTPAVAALRSLTRVLEVRSSVGMCVTMMAMYGAKSGAMK
jgi:hypothetical protein